MINAWAFTCSCAAKSKCPGLPDYCLESLHGLQATLPQGKLCEINGVLNIIK